MEREVSELDRKLILKRNYLDKIYYHLNKDPIDQDELYQFVRKFFGEYLKLDYEFTYEELSQELNKAFIKPKVKEQIDGFLLRLSESEYLEDSSLGTSEINAYLNELSDIIKNIIYEEGKLLEPTSVIKKVFSSKDDGKAAIISGITASIDEITFHINKGNTDSAKTIYANMMKTYESLNKNDKKSLHDQVNAIYEKLQILIKNPERATAEKMYSKPKADSSSELTKLISEASSYIEQGNLELAKITYTKALKIYESLDSSLRINFKSALMQLFEGLQSVSSKKSVPVEKTIPNIQSQLADIPPAPIVSSQTQNLNQPVATNEQTIRQEAVLPSIPASLNENISSGGNVLFGVNSASENTQSNDNISKTELAVSVVNKNEIKDTIKTPAISTQVLNASLNQENLPEMDALPVEEKKILDEDENKIQNFSSDLDKHINSLLSSKNIDTKTVDGDIGSFATDSINKAVAKSTVQESTVSKDSTSTLAPTPDSNNFTLITPVDSNLLGADSKSKLDTKSDSKPFEKSKKKEIPLDNTQVIKLQQLLSRINDDVNIERLSSAKKLYKEALLIYRSLNDSQKAVCYKDFYSTFKRLDEGLHKESLHQIIDKHSDVNMSNTSLNDMSLSTTNASLSKDSINALSDNNISNSTISADSLSTSSNKINFITVGSEDNITSKKSSVKTKTSTDSKFNSNISNTNTSKNDEDEYVPESLEVLKLSTLPVIMDNDPETTRVYELIEESYFNLSNKNNDLAMLKYFKALDMYKRLNIEDKKKTYSNMYELFKTITDASKK